MRYHAWKTLMNGQKVEAENLLCPTELYLCTKFQIWAEAVGCTHKEGLAMFLADDRAKLAGYFGKPERGKAFARSGFKKIEGKTIPVLTRFDRPIKVNFGSPDRYGEISARLIMRLEMSKKVEYVTLQIGGGAPAVYRLDYEDAGTVAYARMHNDWAVTGRLTNISMDWANPHPQHFGIINVNGSVSSGIATLYIWQTAAQVAERMMRDIADTVTDGNESDARYMQAFMSKKAKKPALKNGERIVTGEILQNTTGMICHESYLKNRRPSTSGEIWGFLPGHGGDVWVVKHEHGDAVYLVEEMLVPEPSTPIASPPVAKPDYETTRQRFEKMIFNFGVFEEQAQQIMAFAIPKVEELLGSKNTIDWNGRADGYPDVFYTATFEMNIKPAAFEWIEANMPQAWFKSLFAR